MALSIGVITLNRNQGTYLLEAMNSVLKQRPETYVIYDCGSTDNSRDILDTIHDSRVQKMFIESDNGPAEGLNVALRELKDDIFHYLNADDRLLPGAYNFAREYFALNPSCDVLHGGINLIDSRGDRISSLPPMKFSLWRYAVRACVVYQQATFVRRSIIPENAFNEVNQISWDGELIVDLAIAGAEIHKTNYLLGEFRMHPSSISNSRDYLRRVTNEHSRISRKILSSDLGWWQKKAGILISTAEAILRHIFKRVRHIPPRYHNENL